MITVKMSDIINNTEMLQKVAKMPLKAKLAWQVARLLKALDAEVQQFNETRMQLINKYGEKNENGELVTDEGGNCKIVPENTSEFSNELTELVNAEIEVNANRIPIDSLGDLDFTPSEMTSLEPFIDFGEE